LTRAWEPWRTSRLGRGCTPHWLFFFEVDALEPVMIAARAAGGVVLDPIALPNGIRLRAWRRPTR
jgi:predicted enzyme related to lactoylglutathione lyase